MEAALSHVCSVLWWLGPGRLGGAVLIVPFVHRRANADPHVPQPAHRGAMDPRTLPPCVSREQAAALGWSDWHLARAVRDGGLQRSGRGRYARVADPGFEGRRTAYLALAEAALVAHPGGYVLSHLTAAMAHGLPLPLRPLTTVHLTVDTALHRSRRRAGVVIHHGDSVAMTPDLVRGLPVTPVARTIADCLRLHEAGIGVPLADAAVAAGLCDVDDVEAVLATQVRWRGRPRALHRLRLVDGRRESWLESFAAVTLARLALPLPTPQVVVLSAAGRFVARVDGIWEEDNTVLEVDGKEKYRMSAVGAEHGDQDSAFDAQRRRHDELTNLGLEVVRADLPRLLGPGEELRATIEDRRAAGRLRRFTGRLSHIDPAGGRRAG